MTDLETLQAPVQQDNATGQADLLIAIACPLTRAALSSAAEKIAKACELLPATYRTVLAVPDEMASPKETAESDAKPNPVSLHSVKYKLPPADPGAISWLATTAAYKTISSLANQMSARACTVLGSDLGFNRETLTPERLILLLDPGIEGNFDLVMPLYNTQPFDDLVNKSVLYPLTRALYGHRVRNPLGSELQLSARLLPAFSSGASNDSTRRPGRLPWPATIAANRNFKICQAHLGDRVPPAVDGIDLSDALAQLTGPLFLDMEDNAAYWQRIRGSHEVPTFGNADASALPTDTVDVRRMLEAFQLGVHNLRDVWSLILPPVTLLELKKLSLHTQDEFRMEDSLWARIVYDFALAHRLRNIHRAHLFGAFTPLYLGWAASYAIEINRTGIATAEDRIDQLARAYESEKPYLLSRWRWPDRFHP